MLEFFLALTEFINGRGDWLRWPRDTLYPLKLTLTSPTSGGRSVVIIRRWTKAPEFILLNLSDIFSKWDNPCSVHNSEFCDTVLQIDWKWLNLNIPINTRKYFGLIYFSITLYTAKMKWFLGKI
jgi:hypothetical protein